MRQRETMPTDRSRPIPPEIGGWDALSGACHTSSSSRNAIRDSGCPTSGAHASKALAYSVAGLIRRTYRDAKE